MYFPKLKNVNILRNWGGIFGISPDLRPLLEELNEFKGLILACGCSAHGFCFSQAIGELFIDLILEKETPLFEMMKNLNSNRF